MSDALDISRDGVIYFTDASSKYGQNEYLYDLLEARPHGRLIRLDPGNGQINVLLDKLFFANGVALSVAEDFVLVADRIGRYKLSELKFN